MKTFFKLLLLLTVAGYLIYSFFHLGTTPDDAVCSELKVTITDSEKAGFITPTEVERLLKVANLYPIGRPMDSINGIDIEKELDTNPFIKGTTFYKMPGGKANLIIEQRLPIIRIMPKEGESYYVDERGETMNPLNYNAALIVATGEIDSTVIQDDLIRMALYLRENPFWNDQITQINVNADRQIDLVTRIGGNILIRFGTSDSIERKFNNLRAFYEKVMPEVGWNNYKEIDLGYNHQIVCKKR